jgi:hypothetical protein
MLSVMVALHPVGSGNCGVGAHCTRMAALALLLLAVAGCPTPIPSCEYWRTYVPSIIVSHRENAHNETVVIGRLTLDRPTRSDQIAITLSRLDGDTVVATRELSLPSDGRFHWELERGTYVIARLILFSNYSDGQYQRVASFYPHLRFEAKGTRYIGHALAITDPTLDDILPAYMFVPGTPRQGRLGVRGVEIADALAAERARNQHPTALDQADLETVLMYPKPVEVYKVRTKDHCSRWKYWRLCVLPSTCT